MKKVLVTSRLPGQSLKWLAQRCELIIYDDYIKREKRERLLNDINDCDGVITLITDNINDEVLAAAPRLKVVSNYAVGYNNIDVSECTKRGIWVCNTPGVLSETTADCAWALLMAVARRVVEADQYVRSGSFDGWKSNLFMGHDVYGKTLGIIGMGRIGQAVARRAAGFGMNVIYYDKNIPDNISVDANAVGFEELLQTSDFVSLHVPYLPDTHHLINDQVLKMMKSTAILINTARGAVIDENALALALKNGTIAGAGLDVFEREPHVTQALIEHKNTVLLPHIGSSSLTTRYRMADMAVENLWKVLCGEKPLHSVNKIEGEDFK